MISLSTMIDMRTRFRRALHSVRTEHPGAGRDAAAVALGVFIGCLPVYGFHFLMCWSLGLVLRVNRLKVYLAANISNPLVAPWLVVAEIEAGAWLRRGTFHAVAPRAMNNSNAAVFGADLLVGSLVVGAVLATVAATHTYAVLRGGDRHFLGIIRGAADRYASTSMTAWEFARGKLRSDPVYRAILSCEVLPSGGALLDIGCGQGLTLALLGEARAAYTAGRWPRHWAPPPRFDRMIGIETRRRAAALAREALVSDAKIIEADARTLPLERARVVVLFDVLHMMTHHDQDALLSVIASRLEPGGVVLVRDADASAGWRFTAVWLAIRLKALALGSWRQPFHARTEREWRACFTNYGFLVDTRPMGQGTPFANLLFRLTAQAGQANMSPEQLCGENIDARTKTLPCCRSACSDQVRVSSGLPGRELHGCRRSTKCGNAAAWHLAGAIRPLGAGKSRSAVPADGGARTPRRTAHFDRPLTGSPRVAEFERRRSTPLVRMQCGGRTAAQTTIVTAATRNRAGLVSRFAQSFRNDGPLD
jgi:uncharacterized protein (DUF2062 family)/SAM-dependent methyltransferase